MTTPQQIIFTVLTLHQNLHDDKRENKQLNAVFKLSMKQCIHNKKRACFYEDSMKDQQIYALHNKIRQTI